MKTLPYPHQQEYLEAQWKLPAWADFSEQGTGKTWLQLAQMCRLREAGIIDSLLVNAPSGVHHNWVLEEIPKHVDEEFLLTTRMFSYSTQKKAKKEHMQEVERLLAERKKFCVLAMSFDAMLTEDGKAVAAKFIKTRKCMHIVDEGRRIKDINAKRTKTVIACGRHAVLRRLMNGTPIANSPLDVYSQVYFLDENFWKKKGIPNFHIFKTLFCAFKTITVAGGKKIQVISGYQNLSSLQEMISEISHRVTKADVLPHLPPKIFTVRRFELLPDQRRMYDQMSEELWTELLDGTAISAKMAMVKIIKLQQIACGHVTIQDPAGNYSRDIVSAKDNPRLSLLRELTEDLPSKCIIWARFRRDIEQICEMLGDEAVRYDGSTSDDDRQKALREFSDPNSGKKFFVANATAAGEGLTLNIANTVIYYSLSYNLAERLQSEDRAHRIGQKSSVEYIDLVAEDTVDWNILKSLKNKLDVSSEITLDDLREWLPEIKRASTLGEAAAGG